MIIKNVNLPRVKILMVLFLSLFIINTSFPKLFSQPDINPQAVLEYRNMAPHKAGSWISCISVPESTDPEYRHTWYIGSRNGGIWKTINNGTSYFPVFDGIEAGSIGAIAIAASDPEQVWAGTGEAYNARLSHPGKGVYFSPDGGQSWTNKGLNDSHHISAIIVRRSDPQTVLVAVMGHLFTPNEERGVFKTIDGGESWEKVLYIDDNTGIIDMITDPSNPDIIFASAYEKYRYPWHYEAGGVNSGIYRSVNGGDNWEKLENGLPSGKLGRIGLGLCYSRPEIVYAVIENLNPKPGVTISENIEMNYMRDPYFDQMIGGEVYRSDDGGQNWTKQNNDSCNVSSKAAYSFNKIMVSPDNPDRISISSDAMLTSLDGGKTWPDCEWPTENFFQNMFGDIRCMWIDPHDGNHMMIGSDGGLYISWDGGKNMFHHYHLPLGELYSVEYDNEDPYNIYLGLQDHDGWKAPVNDWSGRIGPEDWNLIGMWDGMYTAVDQSDNRWVYITTQFGGHRRVDQEEGIRVDIEPKPEAGTPPFRFPWTPPLIISPHNSSTIYTGGQFLLRSTDRGENWVKISPDLTTNNSEKIAGKGHMMYCTITTISESPVSPGLILAGTDDGRIHITRNNGRKWLDCTSAIEKAGGNSDYWVTRVLASRFKEGTAFVCKSGFKNDDFTPLIFRTDDFGKTWEKITDGVSEAAVNVIIEDPLNSNILYCGNDEGVFYSLNGEEKWESLRLNMPIVPVKDLKIQPREMDLIVGTYGRGAYICDVSMISQLDPGVFESEVFLFKVESKPERNFSERAYWGNYEFTGDNHLFTQNEPNVLTFYSWFRSPTGTAEILVHSSDKTDTVSFTPKIGLNAVHFPTRRVGTGNFDVELKYNGLSLHREALIRKSPVWPVK